MIVIKVLVQRIIASLISADHCQKDDFYDSLINMARKIGQRQTVVTAVDFDGQAESKP